MNKLKAVILAAALVLGGVAFASPAAAAAPKRPAVKRSTLVKSTPIRRCVGLILPNVFGQTEAQATVTMQNAGFTFSPMIEVPLGFSFVVNKEGSDQVALVYDETVTPNVYYTAGDCVPPSAYLDIYVI